MMKNIKRIVCLLLTALMLVSLAACSHDDGSLEDYLEQNGLPGEVPQYNESTGGTPDQESTGDGSDDVIDINDLVPEGGDVLPDGVVGSWSYVEVYQWAQASDITVDEAISREKDWGVHIGYGSFSRYGEGVENPLYKVDTEASFDSMTGFGIDPSGLIEIFGADASVTSITVCTLEGAACTTIFLVNDAVLIAFGEGMNVFMYEAVEAVG